MIQAVSNCLTTVIVIILYITCRIIVKVKGSQSNNIKKKPKKQQKQKNLSYHRVTKTLPLDLFAVLCLRFNSIDYTFHFPKCHLPEGAGGVCCFHLTDILAMWCTASVGSINQFTARWQRESLTAKLQGGKKGQKQENNDH